MMRTPSDAAFYSAVALAWTLILGWIAAVGAFDHNFSSLPVVHSGEWIAASSTRARFIGWSGVEDKRFRWSDGPVAKVQFRAAEANSSGSLELRFAMTAGKQRVAMHVNGLDLGVVDLDGAARDVRLALPAAALRSDRENELTLRISHPLSPGSHDLRHLGVALLDFRFDAAP
jgi:hypothetical protein